METNLVHVSIIRRKGGWHFRLYSKEVTNALDEIKKSPFPQVRLDELLTANEGIVRGYFIKPNAETDEVPLITGRNITENGIILDEVSYISQEDHKKLARTQLQSEDIVINLLLRPAIAAVYHSDKPANIGAQIVRLRVNNTVTPDYLVHYLNSRIGQTLIHNVAKGSIQRILNVKDLLELPVIFPPLVEQNRIVHRFQQAKDKVQKLLEQATQLQQQSENDFLSALME